jgi:hypothetical protein
MSDAILDLLAELRAVGLVLAREGESLRVRPSSKLSKARQQAILDHKRDLIAAMDAERMASEWIERATCRSRTARPSTARQASLPGAGEQQASPAVALVAVRRESEDQTPAIAPSSAAKSVGRERS